MLCGCLESPFPSSSLTTQQQGSSNTSGDEYVSSFPGNRRLVKTGGNALAEYDPSKHGSSTHTGAGVDGDSNSTKVSATVPPGVSGGQTIHVAAPDGRVVAATVPDGMQAGSSFIVEFPPANSNSQPPPTTLQQSTMAPAVLPSDSPPPVPSDSYHGVHVLPPPQPAASAPAAHHPLPVPVPPPAASAAPPATSGSKPMILVKVPPNTAPGTTLHVKIPNTDRMVAAKVPPGVSEFHVTYDDDVPSSSSLATNNNGAAQMPAGTPMPLPMPVPVPQHTQTTAPAPYVPVVNNSKQQQQHQQQLILVKVPPGVSPGTTLHVQVPGENQMVAAQVPPGVTEFHVAYTPSAQGSTCRPINQQQQSQSAQSGMMGGNGYNGNSRGRNNSGMGYMIPMVAGSALMGAAGMSVFNHHQAMSGASGGQYSDSNGAGGYDGGDFDGGGDFGGGDF